MLECIVFEIQGPSQMTAAAATHLNQEGVHNSSCINSMLDKIVFYTY